MTEDFNKFAEAAPSLILGLPAWLLRVNKLRAKLAANLLSKRDSQSTLITRRGELYDQVILDPANRCRISLTTFNVGCTEHQHERCLLDPLLRSQGSQAAATHHGRVEWDRTSLVCDSSSNSSSREQARLRHAIGSFFEPICKHA